MSDDNELRMMSDSSKGATGATALIVSGVFAGAY
jgi:hypothetical protein